MSLIFEMAFMKAISSHWYQPSGNCTLPLIEKYLQQIQQSENFRVCSIFNQRAECKQHQKTSTTRLMAH